MVWTYREHVVEIAKSTQTLTLQEELAFSEVAYSVTAQGEITEQARFVPMLGMIRLTTRLAERINARLQTNFGDSGWNALRKAVEIRNRITHPKTEAHLEINDFDLATCKAGYYWLFQNCLTAMAAANAAYSQFKDKLDALLEKLIEGDPVAIAEYKAAKNSIDDS